MQVNQSWATILVGLTLNMYKLCFYVPKDAAESVKSAVFSVGAGKIGDYDQCCWQVEGIGQFRALPGADPYIGEVGALESVTEMRVEMVVADADIQAVVQALREAHPYETPAYDVLQVIDIA